MKRIGFLIVALALFVGVQAAEPKNEVDSLVKVLVEKTEGVSESVKEAILLQKLSPEQLIQLEQQRLEVEQKRIEARSKNEMPLNSFAIFMITLLPFVFVIVILYIQARARNRESQRRYDLYMKSLEMGQAVPEHFFDEPRKSNPSTNLKRGILWLAVGLALVIYFVIVREKDTLILGIVPTFVGIGYLLVHLLDKPKKNDEQLG